MKTITATVVSVHTGGSNQLSKDEQSSISVEELVETEEAMDLSEPLTATALGANLCFDGVAELSRLPKGTIMRFPSGAPLQNTTFSKAAKLLRGVVGVVEVAGIINPGDEVEITLYEHPSWLARSAD